MSGFGTKIEKSENEKTFKNETDRPKTKKKKAKPNKDSIQEYDQHGSKMLHKKQKKTRKDESVKKKKKKIEVEAEYSMSGERLKAYGLNPKKLKKKLFNQKMKEQV